MEDLEYLISSNSIVFGSTKVEVFNAESKYGIHILTNEFLEDRETVLLMHGYVGSVYDYNAAFERLGNKYNLLAIDLRGHGSSDIPKDDWTINDFVSDVYQVLRLLIPDNQKINIVGNSLSTAVAIEFTIQYPELVKKLYLISPTEEFSYSIWKKLAIIALKPVPDLIIKNTIGLIGKIAPMFSRDKDYKEFLKKGMKKVGSVQISTHRTILEKTLPSHHVDTSAIDQPVLIIAGEKDNLVPFRKSVELHDHLVDSSIVVLENTKHNILTRRTQLVMDLLEQWLEMDNEILKNEWYYENEFVIQGDTRTLPIVTSSTEYSN
ncbi:MAG: alpha/beta fold hydrolase [Candidatus Kariarchaeaceae archaeon]|jgi:pimeloyl-ACP methyl ester carboxylesterase